MHAARQAVKDERIIAQTIAVPKDHKPVRLPTFPNLERTAVCSLMSNGTTSFKQGATSVNPALFTLCRSPTYPLWGPVVWNNYGYSCWFNLPDGTTHFTGAENATYEIPRVLSANGRGEGKSGAPFVMMYPTMGVRSGEGWIYVPAGFRACTELFITLVSGTFSGNAFQCTIELLTGEETLSTVSTTATSSTQSVSFGHQVTDNTWFRPIEIRQLTGTSGYVAKIALTAAGWSTGATFADMAPISYTKFMPMIAPPEFKVSTAPYHSTRVTACSLLLSNVSRVMYKEGTVLAARLPTARVSLISVSEEDLAAVHPAEKYFGPLEKGCYTFTLPDASSEQFQRCYMTDTALQESFVYPVFNIDTADYFTAIYCYDLNSTDDTELAWTLNTHLEFRTSSMLFQVGFSTIPLEEYHQSQLGLVKLGTIYENPTHLGTITALVKSAIKRAAPVIMPIAARAARKGGQALLSMASTKLGKMTQRFENADKGSKKKQRKLKVVVKKRK